jgi:hypothetical protein
MAMGHDRRKTETSGVMGPRLRGDDNRKVVLNIERMDLKTTHPAFIAGLFRIALRAQQGDNATLLLPLTLPGSMRCNHSD